jgi:tetratricopeptide (TPR) repeat protein
MTFIEAANLLHNFGTYLDSIAQYPEAELLSQRALVIKEHVLGADNLDTIASLNNLANRYRNQGKYELAEPLYQRAVAIHERVLGAEHPHT